MVIAIGWFSTGRDKAARELLQTVHSSVERGDIKGRIIFVFCSRERGESEESDRFLDLVKSYRIPLVSFSCSMFRAGRDDSGAGGGNLPPWRLDYDREVMKRLGDFKPDLCVLAGYMLIVGSEMCRACNMINLHPAAPGGPTGTWQQVIWQLIESGAHETGVMMHLVSPELDEGPPVAYCTFPIRGEPFDILWREIKGKSIAEIKRSQGEENPLFKQIRRYGLAREFPLIISTLRAFGEGKLRITDKKVVDAEGQPIKGYDLTNDIEQNLEREGFGN